MALLLIIPSWLLVTSVVLALCVAARRGDRHEARRVAAAGDPTPPSAPATRGQLPQRVPEPQLLQAGRTAA
jgi:hypothetical protein